MDSRSTANSERRPLAALRARQEIARLAELHHGCLAAIESEMLRRAPGYVGKVVRGDVDLKLDQEQAIIEALGENWRDYLARLAAPIDVLATLESLYDDTEEPRASAELRWAAQRVIHQKPLLDSKEPPPSRSLLRAFRLGTEEQRLGVLTRPKAKNLAFVRAAAEILDEHRYTKPGEAAKLSHILAVEIVPEISAPRTLETFVQAAGVFASAHRVASNLDLAARVLRTVVLISPRAGTPAYVRALQRAVCVLQDQTRYDEAIEVCKVMAGLLASLGDHASLGQVLVDTANSLLWLGKIRPCIESYRLALKLLPQRMRRYRLAAFHGLAIGYRRDDKDDRADQSVARAERLKRRSNIYDHALILYDRGEIAEREESYRSAAQLFRKSRDLLRPINPLDSSSAGLKLVAMLLLQGKVIQAYTEAKSMSAFLKPLAKNPVAEAAITDFGRLVICGKLSVAIVRVALAQLENVRALASDSSTLGRTTGHLIRPAG